MDGDFGGSFVTASKGPVFVRRVGRASHAGPALLEPALFVHGLGGESLDWADVARLLADRVDAYALDLPGFGESPLPLDGDVSIDAQARYVADVLRVVARGSAHLIGNSLGGAITTRVAAENPELVRTLALVSPALPDLRPHRTTLQLLPALLPGIGPRLVATVLRFDPEWMAGQIFATCYGNPASVSDEQWRVEVDAIRRRAELPHSPAVYRASLRSLVAAYFQPGRRRLWRQARQIGVPTLLIYGGMDKLVDARMLAKAERAFPNSWGMLMPDAGHVAQLEYPERVADALRAFLDGELGRTLGRGMSGRRGTVEGSAGAECRSSSGGAS